MRSLLPVCLLLAGLAAPVQAGPDAADPAVPAATVRAKAQPLALTADEKVALALLGQMAGKDRARAITAERLFARLEDDVKLRPLTRALRVEPAALRIRAAAELARIGDTRALRPLLARILREPSPRAR
ncbi:MAG: hypothetical protein P1V36_16595, partial [Planctomycetota bacterium]|nr:hypothetical protein [Planctomycetota bacterium]